MQVRLEEGLHDVEVNAAMAQQQVDTQEWNMNEIERQKRLQVASNTPSSSLQTYKHTGAGRYSTHALAIFELS